MPVVRAWTEAGHGVASSVIGRNDSLETPGKRSDGQLVFLRVWFIFGGSVFVSSFVLFGNDIPVVSTLADKDWSLLPRHVDMEVWIDFSFDQPAVL